MTKNQIGLWNKFWRNKDGYIAIWQSPNIPLIAWFTCMILSKLFPHGNISDGLAFLSTASIFTWAYLEIVSGASYFRRLLGLLVIASVIVSKFM